MPFNHLILCCSFSCLQSFPASGSFPVSQLFASGGQNIGTSASTSVILMNIQGCFPLELTGWISLLSKELSSLLQNHSSKTSILRHSTLRSNSHIRMFSSELALGIRWPKYWSFNFSISLSNEYSALISFRINWFDLLAVQGTLKSLLQHIQKHQFFSTQPSLWSNSHIHT